MVVIAVAAGAVVGNGDAPAGAVEAYGTEPNGFAAAGVVAVAVATAFAGADDATESNQLPAAVVVVAFADAAVEAA